MKKKDQILITGYEKEILKQASKNSELADKLHKKMIDEANAIKQESENNKTNLLKQILMKDHSYLFIDDNWSASWQETIDGMLVTIFRDIKEHKEEK